MLPRAARALLGERENARLGFVDELVGAASQGMERGFGEIGSDANALAH